MLKCLHWHWKQGVDQVKMIKLVESTESYQNQILEWMWIFSPNKGDQNQNKILGTIGWPNKDDQNQNQSERKSMQWTNGETRNRNRTRMIRFHIICF